MSLVLHVDAPRWRAHLDATVVAYEGALVPVVKGGGYGLGEDLLLAEAGRLRGRGVGQVAVGTYDEAGRALGRGGPLADLLVLEPYRAALADGYPVLDSSALVHTVSDGADLADLLGRVSAPRILLEGLTSLNRHGMPAAQVGALAAAAGSATVEGLALHLPLGTGNEAEVQSWLTAVPSIARVYVSHVTPDQLHRLRAANPGRDLRARVGTALWLGAEGALDVRAHVLDVRAVQAGDRAGYWRRRLHGGHLLVVSGGTAHGVALAAPAAAGRLRQRATVLAEAVLESAGRVRSPFLVGGRHAWFVEPPHMQVSLIELPPGTTPPRVGDPVPVRVRTTTLHADAVVLDGDDPDAGDDDPAQSFSTGA
jgi:hypothetical protein